MRLIQVEEIFEGERIACFGGADQVSKAAMDVLESCPGSLARRAFAPAGLREELGELLRQHKRLPIGELVQGIDARNPREELEEVGFPCPAQVPETGWLRRTIQEASRR